MAEDFYDLLGVDDDATDAELKRAYRKRAREYHPDVNADTRANAQFKTVRRAYDVLSDETERSAYDRLGHERYVKQRMKGLPSTDPPSSASSTSATPDASTTTGGSGHQQAKWRASTETSARTEHRRERRQQARRERSGPDARRTDSGSHSAHVATNASRRATHRERLRNRWAAVLVAVAVYVVGLAEYALANRSALDALLGGLASDPVATLAAETGLAAPTAFIRAAVADPSLALLFPAGVAALPLVLVPTVLRFGKGTAWLYSFGALGPLAGLVAGQVVATPPAWVHLALFFVLPVVVTLGFLADVGRYLWATH